MRDLYNSLAPAQSIVPQAITATANGTGVDLSGYEAADILIDLGTFAGTSPTATVKIQESSDNSTFTDVATADLLGGAGSIAVDTTNDAQIHERSYIGDLQYVRVIVSAIGGTSPSLPMGASVVRGLARHLGTQAA